MKLLSITLDHWPVKGSFVFFDKQWLSGPQGKVFPIMYCLFFRTGDAKNWTRALLLSHTPEPCGYTNKGTIAHKRWQNFD